MFALLFPMTGVCALLFIGASAQARGAGSDVGRQVSSHGSQTNLNHESMEKHDPDQPVAHEVEKPAGSWMPEWNASAKAFPHLPLEMSDADQPVSHEVETPAGFWTPGRIASAKPFLHPSLKSLRSSDVNSSRACGVPQQVHDFRDMPYKAIGRLLFVRGSDSYICSASFVSAHSVMMTAGHCCYNDGQWASKFVLTLAYPVKTTVYYTRRAWVSSKWQQSGDYSYDFCFFEMRNSGPGYLGWQSNPSTSMLQDTQAFGYPANYGSNRQLYAARGGYETKSGGANAVWEMSCNPMRAGNSGGPWIAQSRVVGLNSYHTTGDASVEWSPWFGDAMYRTCQAAGGCGAAAGVNSEHLGDAENATILV